MRGVPLPPMYPNAADASIVGTGVRSCPSWRAGKRCTKMVGAVLHRNRMNDPNGLHLHGKRCERTTLISV